MIFGLFDHLDRRDEPLAKTYDDRLRLIAAAEAAGFHSYHLAEHHMTPLGMAPSPGVFLAAVARHTERLRFGPMVYLLPLYHPLRLIEEICMLDNLGGGRLDVGVGRGISPFEIGYYGIDMEETQDIFDEFFDVLAAGLTRERLSHRGGRYQFDDVPMVLRPVQRPAPPMWYGPRSQNGIAFAARHGMNIIALGPVSWVREAVASYREAWAAYADDPLRALSPVADPHIGALRQVFVAESDAEAERLARPAYKYWFDSLARLWRDRGSFPPIAIPEDFDEARRQGALIVGAPATVRAGLAAQAETCGFTYAVLQIAFGNLTHDQEMRSLDLIASEVMPGLTGG